MTQIEGAPTPTPTTPAPAPAPALAITTLAADLAVGLGGTGSGVQANEELAEPSPQVVTDGLNRPDIGTVLVEMAAGLLDGGRKSSSTIFAGCALGKDRILNDWKHPRTYLTIREAGRVNQAKDHLYHRNDGMVTNTLPIINLAKNKKMEESTMKMKVSHRNFLKFPIETFPQSLQFTVATFTIEFYSSNVNMQNCLLAASWAIHSPTRFFNRQGSCRRHIRVRVLEAVLHLWIA